MLSESMSGSQIRQTFINFFAERGHTFVPSSSLVPGGDQTLLFTNAGMVQFKDVFLGTDQRPYSRAANSQKCMRVAGKHNDLDDVGRDDTHHTFFEMLGNWSFGDYYKEEAILWAWELLTEVWKLPKDKFWATCFEDELGEIPRDDEAADAWRRQKGFIQDHVLFFGRKDNFWEMADTGPCGPNSEIHLDRGPEYCDKNGVEGHICQVNGDCQRYLELWNLVFIQYNRLDPKTLEPLPSKHVDTGMGFERIVSVLQNVDSNYATDLLAPILDTAQALTGHSAAERAAHLTPYRVIADHGRAATFLIADGVSPGNTGRNYVCRMIIRRAALFGGKLGLDQPFLAEIARSVIDVYEEAYPELTRHRQEILETLTREEQRFQTTLESGLANLEIAFQALRDTGEEVLPGEEAFDLYATFGLPLEITRDLAREQGLEVDQDGFVSAMEQHRMVSGAGKRGGEPSGGQIEAYHEVLKRLQEQAKLAPGGVKYDPYGELGTTGPVLALFVDGQATEEAKLGDHVEILLPQTCFYLEAGGQVADTGTIKASDRSWEVQVEDMRQPAAGVILHAGRVVLGTARVGDQARAQVDGDRRLDIMRNHTATHLLHAELRAALGDHARQKGSLVAPDRLRFDFNHPKPVTREELEKIETGVNQHILSHHELAIMYKPLQEAIANGAIALFGEKYEDVVRTISIGKPEPFSYELCGGTHLATTADVGLFLITSESSTGSGIRRIEAVTGRYAFQLARARVAEISAVANLLNTDPESVLDKTRNLITDLSRVNKERDKLRRRLAETEFESLMDQAVKVDGVIVLATEIPAADAETLRSLADRFRSRHPYGVAVLATIQGGKPLLIAAVTENLVSRGLHAGRLIGEVAEIVGGGGGGNPTLAQAGGNDPSRLSEALGSVPVWVEQKLQPEK